MEEPALRTPPARAAGVIVPHAPKWHQRLLAWLIWVALRCLAATVRFRVTDKSGMVVNAQPDQRNIFAIWHNRLSLSLAIHTRIIQRHVPARRLATLVSASRDGALLSRILELYGAEPVRGSSSRRGGQALLELANAAKRGKDLAITPDGPRGPCYVAQEGAIVAAQITGLPIVPTGYRLGAKITLRSWDRFQIPLPFSRCDLLFAEPVIVPRELTNTQREELRVELERRLNAASPD